MKIYFLIIGSLILSPLLQPAFAVGIKSIFLFKDVMKSNTTALQTSSFNTLIIFGVGILSNGDIKYYSNTPGTNDVLIASGGGYVGGDALAEKIRSFKARNGSSVDRIEISMNAQNVKTLMGKPGPGEATPLYHNFNALKSAWNLDAINNDDESIYDIASTVAFAKMLGNIGYRYTIAPYTNIRFWSTIKTQLNNGLKEPDLLLDRIYLQCYDGGAQNEPRSWQSTLGMKVVPLVWVTNDSKPSQSTTAAQAKTKFDSWNRSGSVSGGGYWNDYDIEEDEVIVPGIWRRFEEYFPMNPTISLNVKVSIVTTCRIVKCYGPKECSAW